MNFNTLYTSINVDLSSRLALWQAATESASHLEVIRLVRFCRCMEHIHDDCRSSKALFSTSSLSFCNSCLSEFMKIFSRRSWFANSAIFIHPSDVDCIMFVFNYLNTFWGHFTYKMIIFHVISYCTETSFGHFLPHCLTLV